MLYLKNKSKNREFRIVKMKERLLNFRKMENKEERYKENKQKKELLKIGKIEG